MSRKISRSTSDICNFASLVSAASAACLGLASFASADPLPNEELKFFQSPLNGGAPGVYPVGAVPAATDTPAPFLGHDELSTLTPSQTVGGALTYGGTIMADDFLDTNPLPIGHITFWGSYMNNTAPQSGTPGITQFLISLYTDTPAIGTPGTPNYVPSQPNKLIASQTVNLGALSYSSGTFTATPVPPNGPPGLPSQPGDSQLIKYNAELDWRQITFPDAFANSTVPDPVEWLSIAAVSPVLASSGLPLYDWGWHDRDYGIADPFAVGETFTPGTGYHELDDAVQGAYPAGPFTAQNYLPQYDGISSSKDLAFALYTVPVPEPATLSALALAAPALLVRRRRTAR